MKKYSFVLIVFLFLSLSVFFALDSHTIIQDSIIVGEVTLVDDNTLIEGGITIKKYLFALIVFLFLSLSVFFALGSHAIIRGSVIIGEVTLVGDNTLRVKDDATGAERELWSTQAKLKDVNTGYRVEVNQKNEKVVKLKVIGFPKEAEPLVLDGESSLPVEQ